MKKLLSLLLIFTAIESNATHITGGQITSRCLGGLTQEVTLTLYRDVQGIPAPNSISLEYISTSYIQTRNVSQGNHYSINSTTEAYDYVDTVTLPYVDSYTISYTTCCRSLTIANITNPTSSPIYLEMVVYVDSTCNSSPIIPVHPYNYGIVNFAYVQGLNAYDLDGDSISYQLITPLDAGGIPTQSYVIPPLAVISNSNAIFIMTTSSAGTYDICFKVIEYRNGVEIGHVMREMQIPFVIANNIDEPTMSKDNNFIYFDLLGRQVSPSYNTLKIHN